MTSLVERILGVSSAFDAAGIEFAFGGALALAYAIEEPRGTRDIDVNVFVPERSCRAVFESLPRGVAWSDVDVAEVERIGQVRVFWDDTPLDLFFSVHRFHDLASRRVHHVPLAGAVIPVLDATDLAVFKVLFDRTKDWADLEAMVEAGSLDAVEVLRWLDELLGPDDARVARLRGLLG